VKWLCATSSVGSKEKEKEKEKEEEEEEEEEEETRAAAAAAAALQQLKFAGVLLSVSQSTHRWRKCELYFRRWREGSVSPKQSWGAWQLALEKARTRETFHRLCVSMNRWSVLFLIDNNTML
jgi:hypothetical protein